MKTPGVINNQQLCQFLKGASQMWYKGNLGNRGRTDFPTSSNESSIALQKIAQTIMVGLPGFGPGSRAPEAQFKPFSIDWLEIKPNFTKWLKSKNFCEEYSHRIVSELGKRVKIISGPMDIVELFSGLTAGQQHNFSRGVRNLFNFLEAQGFCKDYLDILRKNIPKDEVGFDIKIPSEQEIVSNLKAISDAGFKYKAAYNLALDSGLRLTEVCKLINDFSQVEVERFDGFCVAKLGYFRRTKLAYFGFLTEYTLKFIEQVKEDVDSANARAYIYKRRAVGFKYLRKFAYDTMTSEKLNIPESVADFIQGRVPKTVGARHYMQLKRKATQFYPRYAEYITKLRQKALN